MAYGGENAITITGWNGAAGATDEPLLAKLNRILPRRYQIAAEDVVTNLAVETAHTNKLTLPAAELQVGDRIRITAKFKVVSKNSTDTLAARLRFGGLTGTLLALAPAYAPTAADELVLEAFLRVIASTKIDGHGTSLLLGGTALLDSTKVTEATINRAVANDIVATSTWSVAHADNQAKLMELSADLIRTRATWS